ncbi:hypothetical protein [Dulcicalothrix desertica]|uniref:hypothetical protein n=1 Tax=Dulcicalothrix desertica TaxID=32056 RepID=UPI0039896418
MKKAVYEKNVHKYQISDAPKCDEHLVHLDSVRTSMPKLLPVDKAQEMAEVFALLVDPSRLRLSSTASI